MNIEPYTKVTGIEFTVFGNQAVKKYSCFDTLGVTEVEVGNGEEPKKNGLLDLRMGTSNSSQICSTCNMKSSENGCCGHFGHINLEKPMYHIGFMQYVIKILSVVCPKCGTLRVTKSNEEIVEKLGNVTGRKRLDMLVEMTKDVKFCARPNVGCKRPLPKIKRFLDKNEARLDIVFEFDNVDKNQQGKKDSKYQEAFDVQDVYDILKKISNEDCILMGINPDKVRPEDLIYLTFPVLPVACRPSAKIDNTVGTLRVDDLTSFLNNIVNANKDIKNEKDNLSSKNIEDLEHKARLLQLKLVGYYDNDVTGLPLGETYGTKKKSLTKRLETKEGRFRNNLMGKRVDYSARTVVGPDPCISINEVRIPVYVAKILTFPEYVTSQNIEQLRKCIENGPDNYPGANSISYLDESGQYKKFIISNSKEKKRKDIKEGDIVDRHLVDGDYVLFNRQPSLHKYSMMAHKVKVINNQRYATFGLNIGITSPYNADYDGDEMNITIPRSIQSQLELEYLGNVKKHIVSVKSSKPLVGCKLDAIVGAYVLTHFDIKIKRNDMMNILAVLEIPEGKKEEFTNLTKEEYTGKELYSMIIPSKVNVNNKIKIENGHIIKGDLVKSFLGDDEANSLIRLIYDLYDDEEARKFFDNAQRLTNNFNMYNGFTTSFSDIAIKKDLYKNIHDMIKTAVMKSNLYTTEVENDPASCTVDVFERNMSNALSAIRADVGDVIIKTFKDDNKLSIMKNSGAVSKIKADVICKNLILEAQHQVDGSRIRKVDGRRSQPYFNRDLETSYERGFNQHGFIYGLTLPELINNCITARKGLIDARLKTAESGYVERKLVKNMEDFHVAYDGTVRDVYERVIQYVCGETGINPIYQYVYNMDTINMTYDEIRKKEIFTDEELKEQNYTKEENEDYYEELIDLRNEVIECKKRTSIKNLQIGDISKFLTLVNINKISNIINVGKKGTKLEPRYIEEEIDKFLDHEKSTIIIGKVQNHSEIIKNEDKIKTVLKLLLKEYLSPKRCIYEHKMSKETFDTIIDTLKHDVKNNLVLPGEMVGVIAGETICEYITQENLRSYHLTGVGTKTVEISGFQRISEILNNTKENKSQIMNIKFEKDYQLNTKFAEKIRAYLKETLLKEIRDDIKIYYDPKLEYMKEDNIKSAFNIENEDSGITKDLKRLPWLVRIYLNKEQLLSKNIQMVDILTQMAVAWEGRLSSKHLKDTMKFIKVIDQCGITSNDDNDDKPVIHFRFSMREYDINILHNLIDNFIDNINIKGVSNIVDSNVEEELLIVDGADGKPSTIKEVEVKTNGINMKEIRNLKHVDLNRTYINNINQIYNLYGIEAAKSAIIDELNTQTSGKVNFNHLSILIDYMTREGYVISVDRNGLKKTKASLLSKISFEKPIDQIINAAVFNEYDECKGVSSRIMTGQIINGGTGICKVLLDTNMVLNSSQKEINDTKTEYIDEDSTLINAIINDDDDDFYIPE